MLQHSLKDGNVLIRVKDSAMQVSTMAQYVEVASNFKALPQQKTLHRLNNDLRVISLEHLGFGFSKKTDFPQCVDELAGFKPVRLWAEHICLSLKYLLWKFVIDLKRVKMVDPTLVHAWMSTQWVGPDEKLSVGHKLVCVKQA